MVTGRERTGRVVRDEQAADRQPVREPLRERHELRAHAGLLEGEERPGAADARLHLVEGEERAELVCERRSRGDERRLERDDAALAENGLEQDQADIAGRCGVQ